MKRHLPIFRSRMNLAVQWALAVMGCPHAIEALHHENYLSGRFAVYAQQRLQGRRK
jgi:hypothetical protein